MLHFFKHLSTLTPPSPCRHRLPSIMMRSPSLDTHVRVQYRSVTTLLSGKHKSSKSAWRDSSPRYSVRQLFPQVFLRDSSSSSNPHWDKVVRRRMAKRDSFHAVCLFASEKRRLKHRRRDSSGDDNGAEYEDDLSTLVVVSDDPVLHTHMLNNIDPARGVYKEEIGGTRGFQQFLRRKKPWKLVCVIHGFTSLVKTEEFVKTWKQLYEKRLALLEVERLSEREFDKVKEDLEQWARKNCGDHYDVEGVEEEEEEEEQERKRQLSLSKRESLLPRFQSLIDMLTYYNEGMSEQWSKTGVAPVSLVCRFVHENYMAQFNDTMEHERQRAMEEEAQQQDEDYDALDDVDDDTLDDDELWEDEYDDEEIVDGHQDAASSGDSSSPSPVSHVQLISRELQEEIDHFMYRPRR